VVFAAVVRHGSMSAAGRELGMSASAVSQQVRQLEREGGVTLLHRSTPKLTLTDAGERSHEACAAMVSAAERAHAELSASRDAPSGELRLSAPASRATSRPRSARCSRLIRRCACGCWSTMRAST
jgi:DNA-binding transcriptional LysR family regulator